MNRVAELTAPTAVGSSAVLGGMVATICIALAWWQMSGHELRLANTNLFKRLGCYWALIRLTMFFHLCRYRNKLLAKMLLLVVAALKFQREHLNGIFNRFAWYVAHKFFKMAMPPNGQKLSHAAGDIRQPEIRSDNCQA